MGVVCVHAGYLDSSWKSKVVSAELRLPLGCVPRDNGAEHVCVLSLAGVYAQVWVCKQV